MKSVKILDMKPTQMALGMEEVFAKVKDLSKLSKTHLRKEIKKQPISVVLAPNKEIYIIDGHHRVFAYWLMGITSAPIKIEHRFGKTVSFKHFWKEMLHNHWAHPFDISGEGPCDPLYLAQDIRGVGNDPYRSLAWLVRSHGGYKKTDQTFADFKWAQFFRRKKVLTANFEMNLLKYLHKSIELAHSSNAKFLPGYSSRNVKNQD